MSADAEMVLTRPEKVETASKRCYRAANQTCLF